DPIGREEFIQKIRLKREEGVTVIISSHIVLEIEQLADYIAFIDDGKIKASDKIYNLTQFYGFNEYEITQINHNESITLKELSDLLSTEKGLLSDFPKTLSEKTILRTDNPGVHALDNKIEEKLGITRSPFIKRVITLLRYKIIRTHKIGKILHFFLEDIPPDHDELKALFLNPFIPKLIKEISKNIYISGIQLGNVLNEPVHKIHYYLKKIKDLNIIKKIKDKTGRECYWININLLFSYNKVFKEPHFTSSSQDTSI
ncbi:unnamed protein product, partial [marine sediment metagenome]